MIVPLVAVAVVLAIGFLLLAQMKDQAFEIEQDGGALNCSKDGHDNCSYGVNATAATMDALDDIPGWLPIIVITVIGVLLIGLVGVFRQRR